MVESISVELLQTIAPAIVSGIAIYTGIRADLRHMKTDIDKMTAMATRAHERIDGHLEKAHQR